MRVLSISLFVLLTSMGCGTPRAALDHTLDADAQRRVVADALVEAYDAYEREVDSAYSMPYPSANEARAAAGAHSWHRFEAVLQIELLRRGVSLRAFQAQCEEDPRLADFRDELDRTRGAHLRYRATSIAHRVGFDAYAD